MIKKCGNIANEETVNKLRNGGDDILDTMEASSEHPLGGHTLERHVGKSKEYLEGRVSSMNKHTDGETSYSDKDTAIKATKDILSKNATLLKKRVID